MEISKIIDEVYKKNVYTEKQKKEIYSRIYDFLKQIQVSLNSHKISADVFLGGSSAKGTFLNKGFDCDVFIRFDYEKYKDFSHELSDMLHKVVEEISKNFERVHGSRDYFICYDKKKLPYIKFEIVPVLKIESSDKALNITDVSPLHVYWALAQIKKFRDITKEIVALKLFMKHIGIYGAESYIRGFSGHNIDILTFYYGSFENVLRNALNWKKEEVIDIKNHYSKNQDVLSILNPSKLSPLIIIDPIQPERNSAASLSLKNFNLFKQKAIEFLSNPNKSFFVEKSFSLSKLRQKNIDDTEKLIFEIGCLKGKKDVVGSKLLKGYEYIKKIFKRNDFEIIESDWWWDKSKKAYFWFYISKESVDKIKNNPYILWKGPPVVKTDDVIRFKEKHKNTYSEDGFLFTKVKREFTSLNEVVKCILNSKYIKERTERIDKI